jgi:hypothetical protein
MLVASAMNSRMSTTWVQLSSLLSRTACCADSASPEPQMPLNPASSTMRADRPLCASRMNSVCGDCSKPLSWVVFRSMAIPGASEVRVIAADGGQYLGAGAGHVFRKVDLDPRQAADVLEAEVRRLRQQHVP